MFGEVLDDDELANELDALMATDAEKEFGNLEPAPIIIPAKKQPVKKEAEEDSEEEVAVKPKRQM